MENLANLLNQKRGVREDSMDCMTAVVGKAISATGRVLVAHNEDDPGRLANHHGYVPARDWPEGSYLPAEEGRARIPQAKHTLGYYWSQVRGLDGGLTGADVFYNEKGVCVVSNNSSGSKEERTDEGCLTEGGIGYNLRRIAAERAQSARDALNIIISLVEKWGYAPSGRIYTVADADEAFQIQIVRGHHYIAARVPDDAIVIMPNHYTFHTLTDVPEMYYSPDIITYAVEMGWYEPAVPGNYSDFDFAKAYQAKDKYRAQGNVFRQKYGTELLLKHFWNEHEMPFAIETEKIIGVKELMKFLSYHYEDTLTDFRFGPGSAPHSTVVRRICTGTTIEGTVFEFADKPEDTTLWVACGRPCQVPFVPLHPLLGLPENLEVMDDPVFERDHHFEPRSEATVCVNNGWQRMREYEHRMELCYGYVMSYWSKRRDKLIETFMEENRAALDGGDADEIRNMSVRAVSQALAEIEAFEKEQMNHGEVKTVDQIDLSHKPERVTVSFCAPEEPAEETLILGMGGLLLSDGYVNAIPGSMRETGEGTYDIDFVCEDFLKIQRKGLYDFYLGGLTVYGKTITGLMKINLV